PGSRRTWGSTRSSSRSWRSPSRRPGWRRPTKEVWRCCRRRAIWRARWPGPAPRSLLRRSRAMTGSWKRRSRCRTQSRRRVERGGSLKESVHTAVRTLETGYHLLIFPEGTRSPDGTLQEFKPAIGYLAFAAGTDILPVYLEGTHEAMPKGSFLPDPRKRKKLTVRIGPPLRVS